MKRPTRSFALFLALTRGSSHHMSACVRLGNLLALCWLLNLTVALAQQPTLLGDLDADTKPTVIDLQHLLNHIASGGTNSASPYSFLADPVAFTNDINRTVHGVMRLQLLTDANGEARALWAMGGDSGCGNNRVCVMSEGISNNVYFCASADPALPRQINVGTGNNQKAETDGFLPEPLRAWVNDSCNGNAGMPVTFTVIQGGGKLFTGGTSSASPTSTNGDQSLLTSSATVMTTRTGHAEVLFQLGPDAGQNIIEANYPGNPNLPATFIAYGVARDPSRPTTLTGLLLDNTSCPIGGATCSVSVGGQMFTTTTDTQGRFTFGPGGTSTASPTNSLPAGPAQLFVNGATATNLLGATIPTNSFPSLEFSLILIPNAENSLPNPVSLPRLNPFNSRAYDGTYDLVLTCEGMEGLKMTIKAGSMKDPQGNRVTPANPVHVSLNQVHHDRVPMPIPDGASPPFAWTQQAGGSTFDPPIQIEYPNMSGLPAGTIAYFLSFNHDTRRFEIICSGHVREDSATIVTDPGAGLTIAGWGCNCPPYSVTADCENCKTTCVSAGTLIAHGGMVGNGTEVDAGSSLVFVAPEVTHEGAGIEIECPDGPSRSQPIAGVANYSWVVIGILDSGGLYAEQGQGRVVYVNEAQPGSYECEFKIVVTDPPGSDVQCAPNDVFVGGHATVTPRAMRINSQEIPRLCRGTPEV